MICLKKLLIFQYIVECGVFKGVEFLWLKFLKIYLPNSNKKVIGFDMFSHFQKY